MFTMATTTVLQFMQKTADDEALRHQLEALLGVGDGNISSEAELDAAETEALKGERAPMVAEFAANHGFDFSVDELITVVDAFQKHQAGEMSDADFGAMLGIELSTHDTTDGMQKVSNPLKRLARYMSKTYLGINLPES
jgi:plasmid stability protein